MDLCTATKIPASIAAIAIQIQRTIPSTKRFTEATRDAMCVACIQQACADAGVPRTEREIAASYGIGSGQQRQAFNKMRMLVATSWALERKSIVTAEDRKSVV